MTYNLRLTTIIVLIVAVAACQNEKKTPSIISGDVIVEANQVIHSSILGRDIKYDIILPSNYTTETEKSYPVLYLLHGMGDDNTSWRTKGSAKELVQHAINNKIIPEIIVVMPDALVTFYVNNYQQTLKYETYFEEEFIPYIENHYRIKTTKSTRFIAGLSMGGYGASYHAFKYPEKFAYCYSMSGAVEGIGSPATPLVAAIIASYGSNYASLPDYTMDCGNLDALVYTSNVNTHNALLQLNFEHEYIERSGSHDWTFWKEALPMALERIGKYLK
jgi:S-formylglutathione hydrolase FrmB